ncbi:MAG: GntR family transcriptional regulator [Planctomycetes bacterium]|nr:GntR family transcriptional regulator [Planctomycetota bacterium]
MATALVRQPIYQQLNEALRGLVGSGEFRTGAQFLTEREVSLRFEVSRATANKALSNLVSEGILEFKKGIGTFVRGGVLDYDLESLVSFTGKAAAAGKRPATRVLAFDTLTASSVPPAVAAALRLPGGDRLYSIERLRLADGVPVILERRYVVESLCPGMWKRDFGASLYARWTGLFKLEIAGADQIIRAAAIRGREARLLGVPGGAAGLVVRSLGRLRDGRPLWWERTLYRGDAYEFRNRLGPIQTARPAAGALVSADAEDFP